MIAPGQAVMVIGPNGRRQAAWILTTYQSNGGVTSVWIELCEDFLANPANRETAVWCTRVLVLTERGGKYLDLWQEQWDLEMPTAADAGRIP